jgi:GAF domain-containing protein
VIPFSRGVCGAAARSGETQIVADVEAFPGHIACAASTHSEIVLPVRGGDGALIGVLDIDSDRAHAFDEADAAGLARILSLVFGGDPAPRPRR